MFYFLTFMMTIFLLFSPGPNQGMAAAAKVKVGMEILLSEKNVSLLAGKRIGLVTNHTAVNANTQTSVDLMKASAEINGFKLVALFAPEHGIRGASYASENIQDEHDVDGIPIFSLHGKTRRPTAKMLKNIDLLVFDIQDIGSRSYTYISTLFYTMEEAAKTNIPVIVTDRPNPINGIMVDGPMLEEKWRSFVGYVNVPYCYGMTIGELAQLFNEEHKVGCNLRVIPMEGWKRKMTFAETGLPWIPTSPHIPEANTAFYYPMTGILGELQLVNTGIWYSLPFKLVGAPWIDGIQFANQLNQQRLPGVSFYPFYYKPFFGKFAQEPCEGILIVVTDPLIYKPVTTQYVIIALLKASYPKEFHAALTAAKERKEMFCKVNGTESIYHLLFEKKTVVSKFREFHHIERENFMTVRKKYLITDYQ